MPQGIQLYLLTDNQRKSIQRLFNKLFLSSDSKKLRQLYTTSRLVRRLMLQLDNHGETPKLRGGAPTRLDWDLWKVLLSKAPNTKTHRTTRLYPFRCNIATINAIRHEIQQSNGHLDRRTGQHTAEVPEEETFKLRCSNKKEG